MTNVNNNIVDNSFIKEFAKFSKVKKNNAKNEFKQKFVRKYIGQIVNEALTSQIVKNEEHQLFLLTGNTGAGKSNWMINTFIPEAIKQGERITIASNRTALDKQTKAELSGVKEICFGKPETKTYHKLTNEDLKNTTTLICDEAHFFISDSTFNENAEHNLNMILDFYNKGGKVLFITATEWELKRYLEYLGYSDEIEIIDCSKQTSWADRINITITSKSYKQLIPMFGQYKSICFENISKERIEKRVEILTSEGLDVGYCRSIWIKGTTKKDEVEFSKMNYIIQNETTPFAHTYMTSAYDNGVHIKDENLKYIVIRNIYDIVTIVQMIGRKRFNANNENDKLEVYISVDIEQAKRQLSKIKDELKVEEDFRNMSKEEFLNAHVKTLAENESNNLVVGITNDNNLFVRKAKAIKLAFMHDYLINFLQSNFKKSIANFIAPYLNVDPKQIIIDTTDKIEYVKKKNEIELNIANDLLPLLKQIENEQLYDDRLKEIRQMFVGKFGVKVRTGQLPTPKKINDIIAIYGYQIETVKKMIKGIRYTVWIFEKVS